MNNIIRTEGVDKHYGGIIALNSFDFQVAEGSIHGLIGPNGSGKTTTFNVISGMQPVTAGKIFFRDRDITTLNAMERAKLGINRTFQMPRVMQRMSCLENVMLGYHSRARLDLLGTFFHLPFTRSRQEQAIQEKAMEMLRFVGLERAADRYAGELVWAEQQQLQIARSLCSEPELLMLDEPTSGMGENETAMIQEIIRKINSRGISIILIAHDVKLVTSIADRITAIEFGVKIAEGTPEEILNNRKVVEAYLGAE